MPAPLWHLEIPRTDFVILLQRANTSRHDGSLGTANGTGPQSRTKAARRHVHALPEARRRKQHRPFRVLENAPSRAERGAVPCNSKETRRRSNALKNVLHLRIAGEKAERSPLAEFQ